MQTPSLLVNEPFITIERIVLFLKLDVYNKGKKGKKAQVAQLVERNFEGV